MSKFRSLVEGTDQEFNPVRDDANETQLKNRKAAFKDAIRPIDKKAGAEIHANSMPVRMEDHYRNRGNFGFIGQRINNHQDAAKLAQVYRDPRFETVHMIYTKGDEVVGHSALTNRLPAMVRFHHDVEHIERDMEAVRNHMKNLGADGYWMLHNHPSGKSTPSQADHVSTERFNKEIPGFKGHIVVDHNEYSHIGIDDSDNRAYHETHPIDNVAHSYDIKEHSQPHDVIGKFAYHPREALKIAREFKKDGHAVVIGCNSAGDVNSVSSFPEHLLHDDGTERTRLKATARIRHFTRQTGSGGNVIIASGSDNGMNKMRHLVKSGTALDVVSSESGNSLQHSGVQSPEHDTIKLGGKVKMFGGFTFPHKED